MDGSDALKNPQHEEFCQLVAKGVKPRDAYIKVGYSPNGCDSSASTLQKRPNISKRLTCLRNEITKGVVNLELTKRNSRLLALQNLAERVMTVMTERAAAAAADPKLSKVPGAKTGLLVGTKRAVGNFRGAEIVDEYKVDTGTAALFQSILQHIAKDAGQWTEKVEASLKWDGDLDSLTIEQRKKLMDQFAELAFAGNEGAMLAAKEKAEAEVQRILVQ